MIKSLLTLLLFSCISIISYTQKVYDFPNSTNRIFDITVDTSKWVADNTGVTLTILPKSSEYAGDFVCWMWTLENPYVENPFEAITDQAYATVNSVLTDVIWDDRGVGKYEINGIDYVDNNGLGYFIHDDGSKTQMICLVFTLKPLDDYRYVAIVAIITKEAIDIHADNLILLLESIE